MNVPISFACAASLLRCGVVYLLLAVLAVSPAPGQPGKPVVPGAPAGPATRNAVVKETTASSSAFFLAGQIARAEQELFRANVAKAGTSAWHLESARRLYGMGLYFRARHSPATMRQIAARAFDQIDLAIAMSRGGRDARDEARAMETAGLIHERLLDDPQSALTAHREALRLNPGARFAAEEIGRLTQVLGEIARQTGRK